ncbi:hypothetical protein [Corallococcus caeni]|uniref:Glycosyltransferase RgtA/B/C/D-like domain-containing protein n=1 Tax=Corallococcus caeni TaxID=3082388 RepID=A0ABQ6QZK4_9BACT|nr:hypothetical protein ASNO1_57290 [Corallococcus sp. NO1]
MDPGRAGAWRLALALCVALALWPLFKYQLGPDRELRLRFPTVGWPVTGSVTFQRGMHPPKARELSPEDVSPVTGDGIPEGQQELRIPLPRDARAAQLRLQGVPATLTQVTWVSQRSPPLWGDAHPAQPFTQEGFEGGVHVRVPRLSPGLWALERVDLYQVLLTWGLLWLALETRWGRGRVADFGRRRWGWAKYALGPLLTWGLTWALFFPGLVSYDPMAQWEQVLTGQYVDWHPAFHTWWMGVLTAPTGSLGGMTGLQVVMFAVLLGKVLEELEHWRVPAWARWGTAAWLALSPAVGLNVIAVWKDTAFAQMCLASVLLLLRAERTGRLGVGGAVKLGLCVASLCLLRHNGPLVGLPLLAVGLWRYGDGRARATFAAVAVGVTVFVRGPMYVWMDVQPTPPMLPQVWVIHRLALAARAPDLLPEDAKLLEQIMPLADWRERYDCDNVGRLIFGSSPLLGHQERLVGRGVGLAGVLWRFARAHPQQLLAHQLCVSRYTWALTSNLYVGPFNGGGRAVDPNRMGVRTRTWQARWQARYEDFILRTYYSEGVWRVAVWQPGPSLYLLVAGVLVALRRQRGLSPPWILLAPLLNALSWLLVTPNPDLRFVQSTVLLAPVALALALAPRRVRAEAAARPLPEDAPPMPVPRESAA